MRANGSVESARGLVPFGHLGWGFRGRDEFRARAAEYLADGLAHGQWVQLVGDAPATTLRTELASLPGGRDALERGLAGVCPVAEFYRFERPGVVDPAASVAVRVAAVEAAIGCGHTGMRAMVDATSVARTPEQRTAFSRFELLIDRVMAVQPVSALCAYDLDELDEAAAELVCLHPLTDPHSTAFRLFALDDERVALAGDCDLAGRQAFRCAVNRLLPLLGPTVRVDAHRVGFVDHHALCALDVRAAAGDQRVLLENPPSVIQQLVRILGLRHVEVTTT